MMTKNELEDIWLNKPAGYLRNNYFGRKKLKKIEITFRNELVKTKKLDPVTITVYAKSVRDYNTQEVADFRTRLVSQLKTAIAKDGFDTYNIYAAAKELK